MLSKLDYNLTPGLRYMLLSALGFSLMAVCVKAVSRYDIPVLEIVAARALVSMVISYLDIKRKRISLWGNHKPLLIARGVVGAVALICVYYAVTTLPLAEATILQYLHPIFTALLAFLFLKEAVQRSTLICILLSIIGLVIMVKPDLLFGTVSELPLISVLAALAGALGSAIAYVIVRRLSQTEDSSVIIFYFPMIALPFSIALLGDNFVMPGTEALLLLLLVGIFTQVGQVGLTKAMQHDDASKATAYSYVQVIFALLLGWVFFSEIPTLWTMIGGGLIIIGALINVLWKR
ncbi:DMT family transporter [Amphritea balenae]|uniref:DMT family transporter n=1 Tax=Amphritea balenae TaxID=452629 RepID=A0A3P1SQF9_9GAMM|nr:DMT family transporter [Amphritea balenae]RRC98875.1 DMT family transporter [Amphritea balenae]GGK62481.1 membrane protein [Amphritea balenae]